MSWFAGPAILSFGEAHLAGVFYVMPNTQRIDPHRIADIVSAHLIPDFDERY